MTITVTNDQAPASAAPCGAPLDYMRLLDRPAAPSEVLSIYLSGPMTGYPEWNYPAFQKAAERLRTLGWHVINPAESKLSPDVAKRAEFLADDLLAITCGNSGAPVDGLVFLDGWMKSAGARMEAMVALEMGMRFYLYEPDLRDGVFPITAQEVRWRVATAMQEGLATSAKREEATLAHSSPAAIAPTILPQDKAARKDIPIVAGVIDYFPAALAEVAKVSKVGNDQHNPGQPLHHARGKSTDHADCIVRHLMERGTVDEDGMRHSAKMVWRACALLQEELEAAGAPMARGARPADVAKAA